MTVEKSVVVQGKSIDEALQRAALLLHASTADLAHEVLQQGLVDQRGVVRIPYKLRVLPIVAPPSPREDAEWPEESYAPPFTKKQLAALSTIEFFDALQNSIAGQPESRLEPAARRRSATAAPLEVRGGVSLSSGSIQHDGNVIVNGNVAKGVTINAAGSITVNGDVDVAQLEAGDDIHISGGLLGTARSAFGGVACLFAQGAYIESRLQITVLESSLHSTLIGATLIDVGGAILGGICSAPQLIYAKVAGSETGVVTKLYAGSNSRVRDEAEAIRRQASRFVVKLSEVTRIIKQLEPSETTGMPENIDDRLRLWGAMSEKARLNDRLVALSRRKNALIASIDKDRSARIKIADKVHPQTMIEIDDVGMTVKKLTQFVTFSKDYEAGALRVTSFR